jgi:hypothetical protein
MMGMKSMVQSVLCCWLVAGSVGMEAAGPKSPDLPWVRMKNGHLFYAEDLEHNRIPDFSTVGYEEGEAPIPDLPVQVRVAGPNVFRGSWAKGSKLDAGPHHR